MMSCFKKTTEEPLSDYERLDTQIRYYDNKSVSSQRWFKRIKFLEILSAAGIPVSAHYFPEAISVLGASILVFEALLHLNQWQNNWVTYRSTCEALRHEKYTFLGRAGPYDGLDDESAKKSLVDRVESLISTEHSKWISGRDTSAKQLHHL